MKIQLHGQSQPPESTFDYLGDEQPRPKTAVKLSASRSAADTPITAEVADNDLLELAFDDGTLWYGAAGELPQLLGQEEQRSAGDTLEIPPTLRIPLDDRGGIKEILIEGLKIFEPKELTAAAALKVAARIEAKIVREGVMRIDRELGLHALQKDSTAINASKPLLLLLHGTCSSTSGSFSGLAESAHWPGICDHYGNNMLSAEHYTWTKSPLQNALDIIEQLPEGAQLHLLSHSRGGLIGEILCRCSSPETLFSDDEIAFLEHQDRDGDARLLRRLNEAARAKPFRVQRFVRVAAPAAGTSILSRRLDHFLNFVLNIIGYGIGQAVNPIFQGIRSLLASTVGQRGNPQVLPGLEAMMPSSPLQSIFNNHLLRLPDQLRIVAGNAGIQGIGKTLVYLLTRLYYFTDNDFVVDTESMFMGGRRVQPPVYQFLSGRKVDHFSYFGNSASQEAVRAGLLDEAPLPKGYKEVREGERNRALLHGGSVFPEGATGQKPVVVLLPGIMGSNLHDEGGPIWINYRRMAGGSLSRLAVDAPGIAAESIVGTAYAKLVKALGDDYDIVAYPFDWRLSLRKAGAGLAEKLRRLLALEVPVQIIAHSMGGLVVRDLMMHEAEVWKALMGQPDFRVILLGTPWHGSYLIPEVITGHSRRVKQVALLSLFQSKLDLLKLFVRYPGLYDLLPTDEQSHPFEDIKLWKLMQFGTGPGGWVLPREDKELAYFKTYKQTVQAKSSELDLSRFVYVAGQDEATISSFVFRDQNGFELSLKDLAPLQKALDPAASPFGQHLYELVYKGTDQGDGSVTWRTGIPQQLPADALYYSTTTHMELANDESLFPAIRDLLQSGSTKRLPHQPAVSRSAERTFEMPVQRVLSNDPEALMRGALGMDTPLAYTVKARPAEPQLSVRVKNGDLRYARYPLIVGHFEGDGIVSAEKAIDHLLGNQLSEREMLGLYPGEIGSNLILFGDKGANNGAIVVGLGLPEQLTPFNLAQTIEMGCLEYIFKNRDSGQEEIGVSALLIGSEYGFLALNSSINSLLDGVRRANRKAEELKGNLPRISELELIELHRQKALNTFYLLYDGIYSQKISGNIHLERPIEVANERRTFTPLSNQKEWWKRITASLAADGSLQYSASTGRARVEQRRLQANRSLLRGLLKQGSLNQVWDRELAKTIFELLLPHDFKTAFRSHQNILLILDEHTAWYPWELLHYDDKDGQPICVTAGMIRQLTTTHDRRGLKPIKARRALVIGDPILELGSLPQLPEAEREARDVGEMLGGARYDTKVFVQSPYTELVRQLYKDFKIIHIASHGVMRFGEEEKTGILLSDDIVLTPAEFNQISGTPELVFINSCYMGKIEPEQEAYFQNKYELAANIGTQLIQNGVKAVVVAGWAVNDSAARLFAKTFYAEMLGGAYFGEAVKAARASCYRRFPHTTTWGAYQCYGDQFFVLEKGGRQKSESQPYVLDQEILIDLENAINWAQQPGKRSDGQLAHLQAISRRIEESGLRNGKISEWEARAYASLGEFKRAIACYQRLQASPDGDFSVKAIEQWCNLRVRVIAQEWEQQMAKQTEGGAAKEVLSAIEAEAEAVIVDLKSLLRLGKTAERLSLLGSAYKRRCIMAKDSETLTACLEQMAEYYKQACLLDNEDLEKVQIYPLSNWITAEKLLKDRGRLIRLSQLLPERLSDHLDTLLQHFKAVRDRRKFWDFIALINVYQCKLLDAETQAERRELRDAIVEEYRAAWRVGGAEKQKNSELAHTQFVHAALQRLGGHPKGLEEVLEQLVDFFKTL